MSQPTLSPWQRSFVLSAQRFIYWLTKHWLALANFFIFLLVAAPFAAPIFLRVGWEGPARAIYTVYKPLCHQLAFRSVFLNGEQVVYPRAEYELLFGLSSEEWPDVFAHARDFHGNEALGYKVAFCQRDIAIYGSMLLGGLLYAVLRRRRLRPMPFWLFLLLGVLPMALDGGSQFVSLIIPGFPARESVWQLRFITGALFGLSLVWLAFPYIQEGMDETRETLAVRYGWNGHETSVQPKKQTTRDQVVQILEDHDVI